MNKKTLLTLIIVAAALIAGIAVGVALLYSGKGQDGEQDYDFLQKHKLVTAVPSDAAIVFCVKDFGRACELLSDSTALFGELLSGQFKDIATAGLSDLRKAPVIFSVHYSKDMPALMVIEAPEDIADSTEAFKRLMATAEKSGLRSMTEEGLILLSPSETVINSSVRHISGGNSILDADGFREITDFALGDDLVFFSHAYADKLLGDFASSKHRRLGAFVKELADWSVFSLTKKSENSVSLHGNLLYDNDPYYFMNVLRKGGAGTVTVAEAVPADASFVAALPIGNIKDFLGGRRDFLDANGRLDQYENAVAQSKGDGGIDAEEWAKRLDIKEIASVTINFGDKSRKAVLVRPGVKFSKESAAQNCSGFPELLFGEMFKGESDSTASVTAIEGWLVFAQPDVAAAYSETEFLQETLADRLKTASLSAQLPARDCGFWMYCSLGENPEIIENTFSPRIASGCRKMMTGVNYAPVFLTVWNEGETMSLDMDIERAALPQDVIPASAIRDSGAVIVPEGPFKVKNCGTGQINTFYQNSHLSICLQDENGKDMWGVPFKEKICGYVQEVDYYNNGKIQFLFAAGSKLYLIDRLGRFVSGFPAETGRSIAAGPAVYDFTGAKGYTAMVLHKDNTVGYYNLHGETVESWGGITADETILTLPELLEGNGERYWIVRTSLRAMIFPFNGGEPLVKGEAGKTIKTNSIITVTDKGFSAECTDGKTRILKPER